MGTPRHETHAALRQEIDDLERRWASALLDSDPSALRRLLSDHVVVVTLEGAVGHGRDAALRHLLELPLRDIDVTHATLRVLGPDAVLVSGRAVLGVHHDGPTFAGGPVHYTRVWQQRNDRWLVAAAHTSALPS